MKTCSKCLKTLPLSAFPTRNASKDGKGSQCKTCRVEYRRSYMLNPKTRAKVLLRDNQASRASKYDTTVEELASLFSNSDGTCHICKKLRRLNIDHNHKTGKVRGLLCTKCNWILGAVDDDDSTLLDAIIYIKRSAVTDLKVTPHENKQ